MKDLIAIAVKAAQEAGLMLLENEQAAKDITVKQDRSLVTDLDERAERMVVDIIKANFPGHGMLCEEGSTPASDGDYLWIVDPLDGTHNYIRGIPHWGVSIGIVQQEQFIASVIFMPPADALYVAEKGSGAFRNDERIRVSDRTNIAECTLSFDSCIREDPVLKPKVLAELGRKVFNIRMLGASTSLLTLVAEGKMDIAIEFDDKPWDFAAGALLVLEAGGSFTDFHGNPTTYRHERYIASNGLVHEEVCGIVRGVI